MEVEFEGPTFYCHADENTFFNLIYSLPEYNKIVGSGKNLCLTLTEPVKGESVEQIIAIFKRWQIELEPLACLKTYSERLCDILANLPKSNGIEFKVVEKFIGSNPEITNISYDIHNLIVKIEPEYDAEPVIVKFSEPMGHRVLDEGDLLEFWGEFNLKDGWLFEVTSGGWFTQESQRSGFLSQHQKELLEYIIIGVDECVSVFSMEPPTVLYPNKNK